MSIFEFDEERYKRMMREEYLEEGPEEGRKEGQKIGLVDGQIKAILDLLGELGEVPEVLKEKILDEQNLKVLSKWVKLAAKAQNFAEFEKGM